MEYWILMFEAVATSLSCVNTLCVWSYRALERGTTFFFLTFTGVHWFLPHSHANQCGKEIARSDIVMHEQESLNDSVKVMNANFVYTDVFVCHVSCVNAIPRHVQACAHTYLDAHAVSTGRDACIHILHIFVWLCIVVYVYIIDLYSIHLCIHIYVSTSIICIYIYICWHIF